MALELYAFKFFQQITFLFGSYQDEQCYEVNFSMTNREKFIYIGLYFTTVLLC